MNTLVKNSARLLSANVVAQVIGLVIYPILTRLYAPEDFGLLTYVLNIGGILIILSTAEYQNAIVLAKTKDEAKALVQLSGLILFGFVVVISCLAPFTGVIATLVNEQQLSQIVGYILPFIIILMGLWNILNMYYTYSQRFAAISQYKMSQSIITAGSKLAFGYGGILHMGLLYSTLIGLFASLVASIATHWKMIRELAHFDWPLIHQVARTYRSFPLFSLPRSLVNVLGAAVPALMLTPVYGLADMGYLSMALTLAFLPVSLIVNSFQQVLYQQVADRVNHRQSILSLLTRINRTTLYIVIPFFTGLWFILPWLAGWLLGDSYTISGHYIRWMLPWLVFTCLNGMICFVVDVFMQQRIGLIFECVILALRIIGLAIGMILKNFEYAVIGYCLLTAVALLVQLIWFYFLIRRYERTEVKAYTTD